MGSQHDTEGWKCLETSFKVMQCLIEGTGEAIAHHLGEHERGLIYRALLHPNRFVRETGFLTMNRSVNTKHMQIQVIIYTGCSNCQTYATAWAK